ncbi:MAG: fused MFS/spermidine synthase [Deltaproteobacteria bacterium]|nr:fused MFS/spermidine synthase [Deltaproteobacteria bacterium]
MSSQTLHNRPDNLILLFFFITGLTGLAYELVWIRLLILAFGSTQFAVTTVLVTFMAGLALGSLVFGRIIDRFSSPLKAYAAIETALGIYCILSPFIFSAVKGFYLSLSVVPESAAHAAGFEAMQFMLSFLALIVPTTLMGGTFPALVKYFAGRSGRVGFHTAVPYAVNTLGAVAGCLLTGFYALYFIGVKTTVYAAGAVDILVGVAVFLVYCTGAKPEPRVGISTDAELPTSKGGEGSRWINRAVIAAFTLSGFASLVYEVLWSRVLSLVIGSSIYAFTVMLATFLIGIAAGSIIFAPFIDRRKTPLVWFASLEAIIGVASLLGIFLYKELPFALFSMKEAFGANFWLYLFLQFLLVSAVMIIPTLCMGAIFPLVGRIYTKGLDSIGRNIGAVYFFNTFGAIFGAFVGGFVIIPLIGVQAGVVITAALNVALAVLIIFVSTERAAVKAVAAAVFVAAFAVSALMLPRWEKTLMTLGLYVNQASGKTVEEITKAASAGELVYYREGINAVITVRKSADSVAYQANGKQEARAVDGRPSAAWALLGHLPALLHGGIPQDALVVGLGSGITLGAMTHHPIKNFDVIELESAVVEASGFFLESNGNALADPRVKLHVTDGRGFLFSGKKKYDIIVSGVSDPWITGVSNLFTREYFSEVKDKLNANGVAAVWFQNYRITHEELKAGLNTIADVFPHVSVWFHYTDSLDLVVMASKTPHALDLERLKKIFSPEGGMVREGLLKIGLKDPYDVFATYLMGNADAREYLKGAALNTDERPYLEFMLPKRMYMDPGVGVKNIEDILTLVKDPAPPVEMAEGEKESFYADLGKSYNKYNFRLHQSLKLFEKALEKNPENREAAAYAKALRKEIKSGLKP